MLPVLSSLLSARERREAGILPDPGYGGEGDPALERSLRKRKAPCQ